MSVHTEDLSISRDAFIKRTSAHTHDRPGHERLRSRSNLKPFRRLTAPADFELQTLA